MDPGYADATVKEKDINLAIGCFLAPLLRQEGYDVLLTRSDDATLSLSERINMAHAYHADIFFSIHTNAGSKKAVGIETFYLDNANLKHEVARMDKKTKTAAAHLAASWTTLSKELADDVQVQVLESAKKLYPAVVSRGIKSGSCQVLMGFQGPAALIEAGYLTSDQERAFLGKCEYQKQVARGICKGIKMFIDKHFA